MSLINSLGKHPASHASCLDGEAATAPATGPRGERGVGVRGRGTASPELLLCCRRLREGQGVPVACPGLLGESPLSW